MDFPSYIFEKLYFYDMIENSKIFTIAFYNIENLFDIENDPYTNDDDFLPTSAKRWTYKRYQNKLRKLGSVISQIGENESGSSPAIVGLAEVENNNVLTDLIHSEHLKDLGYNFVHFDSLDERGIDVALIYKEEFFNVENSETFSVYLQTEFGDRDYTRDILLVQGKLNNKDGWFVALTPKLVTITWVGNDNHSIGFKSTGIGQGANSALPVFAKFYQKLNKDSGYKSITNAKFESPSEDVINDLDCEPTKRDGFIKRLFKRKNKKKKFD